MTITLQFPADAMERLRAKAAKNGQSVEAFLQGLAEREASSPNGTALATSAHPAALTTAQWSNQWQTWAAGHPAHPGLADDSRESIYSGRGE